MNKSQCLLALAAMAIATHVSQAQAPAGSTGQCKDGTYTTAASKSGACRGHKGVQTWLAATPTAPAQKTARASAATPAAAPAPAALAPAASSPAAAAPAAATASPTPAVAPTRRNPSAEAASRPQAAGGGPGTVWLNTSTKVYHCAGSEFYGKTKEGKYVSEADAKAMGAHADHNKPCSR